MKPVKRIPSSFSSTAWWSEQAIEQWRARLALSRAITAHQCKRPPNQWLVGALACRRKQAGRIIAVTDEPFSGGEQFARAIAARLGWQYVDSSRLIETAVCCGGNKKCLEAALNGSRWRARQRRTQVLLLQAALARTIKDGNVVCYGTAADLLNLEPGQVRRIVILAPDRSRREAVVQHNELHGAEARIFLNECDRARRHWRMQLLHSKAGLPSGYDLAINLEELTLETALMAAWEMIREPSALNTFDPVPIENFILLTSIQAGLAIDPATAQLDLDVEIVNKSAVLRGKVRDAEDLEHVRRVLVSVSPRFSFDLSQIQVTKTDGRRYRSNLTAASCRGAHRQLHVKHRFAWTVAALSALMLALVGGFWLSGNWPQRANGGLLTIAGMITDSDCGLSHNIALQTGECVRACVRSRGAKYVLSNGGRMFPLADQRKAAALAGEKVIVTGSVDASTGDLRLRALRTLAP